MKRSEQLAARHTRSSSAASIEASGTLPGWPQSSRNLNLRRPRRSSCRSTGREGRSFARSALARSRSRSRSLSFSSFWIVSGPEPSRKRAVVVMVSPESSVSNARDARGLDLLFSVERRDRVIDTACGAPGYRLGCLTFSLGAAPVRRAVDDECPLLLPAASFADDSVGLIADVPDSLGKMYEPEKPDTSVSLRGLKKKKEEADEEK